jgi:hypothetical protein
LITDIEDLQFQNLTLKKLCEKDNIKLNSTAVNEVVDVTLKTLSAIDNISSVTDVENGVDNSTETKATSSVTDVDLANFYNGISPMSDQEIINEEITLSTLSKKPTADQRIIQMQHERILALLPDFRFSLFSEADLNLTTNSLSSIISTLILDPLFTNHPLMNNLIVCFTAFKSNSDGITI